MSDNPPDWISNYPKFTSKLKCNFRLHNPKGDMENELKALQMKDNQWIVKYLVDFNHLTTWVTWGDSALWHQLYKELPNQIKDEVSQIIKPSTLSSMHQLIQQIDMHNWECQSEISQECKKSDKKSSEQKSNKSANSTLSSSKNQPSDNKSTSSSSNMRPNPDLSGSSRQNKKPDLSNKLRKDSKLTSKECDHWFTNNLCMFCGGTGHKASECPKNTSTSKAKAQAPNAKKGSSIAPDDLKK